MYFRVLLQTDLSQELLQLSLTCDHKTFAEKHDSSTNFRRHSATPFFLKKVQLVQAFVPDYLAKVKESDQIVSNVPGRFPTKVGGSIFRRKIRKERICIVIEDCRRCYTEDVKLRRLDPRLTALANLVSVFTA